VLSDRLVDHTTRVSILHPHAHHGLAVAATLQTNHNSTQRRADVDGVSGSEARLKATTPRGLQRCSWLYDHDGNVCDVQIANQRTDCRPALAPLLPSRSLEDSRPLQQSRTRLALGWLGLAGGRERRQRGTEQRGTGEHAFALMRLRVAAATGLALPWPDSGWLEKVHPLPERRKQQRMRMW
jgi:hypothetical protein